MMTFHLLINSLENNQFLFSIDTIWSTVNFPVNDNPILMSDCFNLVLNLYALMNRNVSTFAAIIANLLPMHIRGLKKNKFN